MPIKIHIQKEKKKNVTFLGEGAHLKVILLNVSILVSSFFEKNRTHRYKTCL